MTPLISYLLPLAALTYVQHALLIPSSVLLVSHQNFRHCICIRRSVRLVVLLATSPTPLSSARNAPTLALIALTLVPSAVLVCPHQGSHSSSKMKANAIISALSLHIWRHLLPVANHARALAASALLQIHALLVRLAIFIGNLNVIANVPTSPCPSKTMKPT